jgi:glutamine kinase
LGGVKAETFIEYARNAIEMRESSKFVFSKVLSRVLEIVAEFAQNQDMGRKEISFFSIQEILSLAEGSIFHDQIAGLKEEAKRRQRLREIEKCVTLPLLLFDAENIFVAPFFTNQPNFITSKIVSGEVRYIRESGENAEIENKIVLIESADPGYDWIFSHNIKGLITKFGGVNSHMSIRCAEFYIPSAIGCGSILFDELMSSNTIRLDCASSQLVKLT